jgi:NitT/TauT family transport system permease protein
LVRIWLTSKVVITALICFFPILVSVISGFHPTDRDHLDMMKAYGATTWQAERRPLKQNK